MISDMQSKAIALLGILVVCSKLNHALLDPPSSWLDSVNKKLETFQAKLDQCERQIGKSFYYHFITHSQKYLNGELVGYYD